MSAESLASYLEKTKTASHWSRIGIRPHHGICLPLFSLRTKKSCGIGDFGDLLPLIDWCKHVGFDCIQLLPLNDTAEDPSPYNALSSCALDPIYLNLRDFPQAQNLSQELAQFAPFNDLARLPHFEVRHQKMQWLYRYFERTFPDVKNSSNIRPFSIKILGCMHIAYSKPARMNMAASTGKNGRSKNSRWSAAPPILNRLIFTVFYNSWHFGKWKK